MKASVRAWWLRESALEQKDRVSSLSINQTLFYPQVLSWTSKWVQCSYVQNESIWHIFNILFQKKEHAQGMFYKFVLVERKLMLGRDGLIICT
jgi:hypothetical protein